MKMINAKGVGMRGRPAEEGSPMKYIQKFEIGESISFALTTFKKDSMVLAIYERK